MAAVAKTKQTMFEDIATMFTEAEDRDKNVWMIAIQAYITGKREANMEWEKKLAALTAGK